VDELDEGLLAQLDAEVPRLQAERSAEVAMAMA
jgi:uncharacterized small protein (DUF1192 family)